LVVGAVGEHSNLNEAYMATQPIANFQQISSVVAARALHQQIIPRRAQPPVRIRPVVRKEARQALDRQRLLVELLPLVKRIAFKIREHLPPHVEMDDLVGNGMLGLVDAVAKFDARKQVKLESYARHRIRGAILDGLRVADPASRDMRRKNKNLQKVHRELEVQLGRAAKDEEMAAALGVSLDQWHQALGEMQAAGFDCGARTLSAGPTSKPVSRKIAPALLVDESADPFELCYRREQKEILGQALLHLRERDRQIIALYYEKELTMRQIADRLRVDESRISQLHSAALVRLKSGVDSLLRAPVSGAAHGLLQRSAGGAA
jgi:RNA polymerase sigma factor FliA